MPFILKPRHLLACQLVLFSAIVSGSLHVQQGVGCSVRSSDFAGHSTKAVRATGYYAEEDMGYVLQIQGPDRGMAISSPVVWRPPGVHTVL